MISLFDLYPLNHISFKNESRNFPIREYSENNVAKRHLLSQLEHTCIIKNIESTRTVSYIDSHSYSYELPYKIRILFTYSPQSSFQYQLVFQLFPLHHHLH